jgi:hypothetical protein
MAQELIVEVGNEDNQADEPDDDTLAEEEDQQGARPEDPLCERMVARINLIDLT